MEKSDVLKWLLGQAYRADKHKKRLDQRLEQVRAEKTAPAGSHTYSFAPKGQTQSDGAAAPILKQSDIEERIEEQKREIDRCVLRVMEIIDYIPINDLDREIFEMRHIDFWEWPTIEREIPMSKRQCMRRYNDAIDRLLQIPEIQKMVDENEDAYLLWYAAKRRPKN